MIHSQTGVWPGIQNFYRKVYTKRHALDVVASKVKEVLTMDIVDATPASTGNGMEQHLPDIVTSSFQEPSSSNHLVGDFLSSPGT